MKKGLFNPTAEMLFKGLGNNLSEISSQILNGRVGVIPSDTLYGFSCSAFRSSSVERVYDLKGRAEEKPFIVLIDSISALKKFDIHISPGHAQILEKLWPNKLSVILSCPEPDFKYLHRGTDQIAFRIPKYKELIKLLKITGPLISTSVNKSGDEPLTTVEEAMNVFGDTIDFYVDVGELKSLPTTVVKLVGDSVEVVRQGDYIVDHGMLK